MKGSYVLIIENKKDQNICVGKLGNILFKKGFYAYVGSALNSLEGRINRHKRTDKKFHWHVDYLLDKTEIVEVFYKENNDKEECVIAKSFSKFDSIKGFGCSDCKCQSHLFYGKYDEIKNCSTSLNLVYFKI